MKLDKLKRRVGAYVVMDIYGLEERTANLVGISGPIVDSNFLEQTDNSEWPIMAEVAENLSRGDRVKLVFFTTRGELDSFNARKSRGFTDTGLRYFKWNDGWDLIYEG